MHRNARTGYLLAATSAAVWSLTSPGLRYLLETYGVAALALAFWRDAVMALACVLLLALFRPGLLHVAKRDLGGLALLGVVGIGIYHALWLASLAINGAAVAVVLIYTFPTFVALGSWLLYRTPLRRPQIIALVLSLIGCALIVRVYDPAVLRLNWLGAVVGLLTGLTQACYVLFSQRAVRSHSPWTALTYTVLFGTLTLLVLLLANATLLGGAWAASASLGTSPWPWLILAALAIGPTLGGYAMFNIALQHAPAQIASLVVVLEVPLATLLAVWLLGERLEWPQVLGMILILGAMLLPAAWDRWHNARPVPVAVPEESSALLG